MKSQMKYILTSLTFLSLATAAFAHCGSCGVGDEKMSASDKDHHDHPEMKMAQIENHFDSLLKPYLSVQNALANDDLAAAKSAATLPKNSDEKAKTKVAKSFEAISEAANISVARDAFDDLSKEMIILAESSDSKADLYVAFCPMALGNKGAKWIQDDKTIANPYFGESMLRCGRITSLNEN